MKWKCFFPQSLSLHCRISLWSIRWHPLPTFFCSTALCPASVFPLNSQRAGLVLGFSPVTRLTTPISAQQEVLHPHWTQMVGFPTPVWSDVKTHAQRLENSCSWICLLTFRSCWVIPQTRSQVLVWSWPRTTAVSVTACQMNECMDKWTNSWASTPSEVRPLAFKAALRL